jgi:1-phosphofructokinase
MGADAADSAPAGESRTDGDDRVTVCVFSPVTLLTITLERSPDGGDQVHLHAGGQGVWMARMIATLGGTPVLCAALGGETGAVVRGLLDGEGIVVKAVETTYATPTWIHDRREGSREALWEDDPPTLPRHEADELYSIALAEALDAGVCVLAGTHGAADVLPENSYRRLVADMAAGDVLTVVDVSGDQLREVLEGGVHLMKVSAPELVRDGLAKDETDEAIWDAVEALHDGGAANVVVSRSSVGALALGGQRFVVVPPKLEVADARGAGDSMTAAFGLALARRGDWPQALRLGTAAGAMAVTRHGSGSGRADAIAALAERVTIESAARAS